MSSHEPIGAHASMSARERFAALQHQVRPRRWLTAIVVGAATGLFANLVLAWWSAVLAAIATSVALLLVDRRRGFLAGWWPGDTGLHQLAAATARLERHGWTILPIPTTGRRNTAHHTYLLIGPAGVFVVEHQVWTITDTITTHHHTGLLQVGRRPAVRRTASVRATAAAVDQTLSHTLPPELKTGALLAVDGKPLDEPLTVAGVTIVPTTDLTRLLHRSQPVLTTPEIATVTTNARQLFTPQ